MPQIDDVGVVIRLTITKQSDGAALDISAASTTQIDIRKPDGTLLNKTASLTNDGADGKMECETASSDLDIEGEYEVQGYVVISGSPKRTTKKRFDTLENA
ncbi:MAG: hypothetical protein KDJ65_01645 [Anaerolineae bacterium]|nr:hypothetical protein [Anaerolineae bacterium]